MKIHIALLKNWWVIVCPLMAGAIYMQAMHQKNLLVASLEEKVAVLSKAQADTLEKKEELLLRIQSQDDPTFIELVLKEKLGVIREGETKVVFQ